jgi:hypothetical protein
MANRRLRARVATTHPLPAYGGIRLAESAIRQLADQLATGGVPMTYQHDPVRPVNCMNVAAGIEKTEDGEFAAWIEFDVDEDEWQLYDQERQKAGAPGGWSFTTVDNFASRGQSPYDIEIAADASYFDDDFLLAVAGEILPGELTVTLGRLYQFSWVPDPKILIGIAQTTLMSIPANLLSSYLYDFARKFKAKLAGDSRMPTFEIRVRRQRRSKTTTIKITATDDYGLRQAMESVPEILRQEGKTAYWDDTNHRWEQIATGAGEGDEPKPPFVAF